jgi:hypothetical protein
MPAADRLTGRRLGGDDDTRTVACDVSPDLRQGTG